MILEYKMNISLINNKKSVHTPFWVENGGYFFNPDNKTLIGFSPTASNREYKIPDVIIRLTSNELDARVQGIHNLYPMKDEDGNTLITAEVTTLVNDCITANDIT